MTDVDISVVIPKQDHSQRWWYVLWAPTGFGGTTERIVQIQKVIQKFDEQAEVWYPLYPETINGVTTMKAFYAGYMFVRCIWHQMMESTLLEQIPVHMQFLVDVDTHEPHGITDAEMGEVTAIVNSILEKPDTLWRDQYKIGTSVKVLKKSFFGHVGKLKAFMSIDKVIVELEMFGRIVPVEFHAKDLEILL